MQQCPIPLISSDEVKHVWIRLNRWIIWQIYANTHVKYAHKTFTTMSWLVVPISVLLRVFTALHVYMPESPFCIVGNCSVAPSLKFDIVFPQKYFVDSGFPGMALQVTERFCPSTMFCLLNDNTEGGSVIGKQDVANKASKTLISENENKILTSFNSHMSMIWDDTLTCFMT